MARPTCCWKQWVANIKLTSDKYWLSPLHLPLVWVAKYKGYYSAFVPAGLGLQINLLDDVSILLNTQYRMPLTRENGAYHLYHNLGIAGNIGKKPRVVPASVILPPVVEAPKYWRWWCNRFLDKMSYGLQGLHLWKDVLIKMAMVSLMQMMSW